MQRRRHIQGRLSCFRLRLLKIHATLFAFLKNKVAYVPYHNLKAYLVSKGWC